MTHDGVGGVVAELGGDHVLRHHQRDVAPGVGDGHLDPPAGDEVDGVPRLLLAEGDPQVGVGVEQAAGHGCREAAHRGGEAGEAHVPRDRAGVGVELGLDAFEVGEEAGSVVDQPPPGAGEQHAPPDALEECDAGLLLEPLDLLRHRARREAERVGRGDDGAVLVDGAEGLDGSQVDHEATLQGFVRDHSLVLHGRRDRAWTHESS
ncbi:hypothetical protein QE366_000164 [Nocardioides zeae]|nr:hypothetical protein [Nocardioides zeae]